MNYLSFYWLNSELSVLGLRNFTDNSNLSRNLLKILPFYKKFYRQLRFEPKISIYISIYLIHLLIVGVLLKSFLSLCVFLENLF